MQKVFVYGTLKMGFHNHQAYLTGAKPLGNATVEGLMFHLEGYPAINISEQFSIIHGEVYECTWDHILDMDRLEGVDRNFYDRAEVAVKPHGVVWTYIFPRNRAERLEWIVPTGIWSGPSTQKVKWGGFGKGVILGSFATNREKDEIRVGQGPNGDFSLVRGMDSTYKLVRKSTGEILDTFHHLRDLVDRDTKRRTVIGLPRKSEGESKTIVCARCGQTGCEHLRTGEEPRMTQLVNQAIRETLKPNGAVVPVDTRATPYSPAPRQTPALPLANVPVWDPNKAPVVYTPKDDMEDIPQAARMLNIKYGAA